MCNLVLILSGSIYFWSEYNSSEQEVRRDEITLASRIYTGIFIILGFVLMVGIIVYHIMLKIPKKKRQRIQTVIFRKKTQKEHDEPETENVPHTGSINGGTREELFTDSSDYREDGNGTGETTTGVTNPRTTVLLPVRTVELREPLLESGSLSYHQVDTSFVPRAVQDFISDLRH